MSEYLIQGATLTSIADAIRQKTNIATPMPVSDFADMVKKIPINETPTILVDSAGYVTASVGEEMAEHQLSSADDGDFIAANIVSGKTIFGLNGTAQTANKLSITIENNTNSSIRYMSGDTASWLTVNANKSTTTSVWPGSIIVFSTDEFIGEDIFCNTPANMRQYSDSTGYGWGVAIRNAGGTISFDY